MGSQQERGSLDGRIEQAKSAALGSHDGRASTADELGEAAGGITGTIIGAAVGLTFGVLGAIIGGIGGALGGWWTGRAVSEGAEVLAEDDASYAAHHGRDREVEIPMSRETIRGLGHIASTNPNFLPREPGAEPPDEYRP